MARFSGFVCDTCGALSPPPPPAPPERACIYCNGFGKIRAQVEVFPSTEEIKECVCQTFKERSRALPVDWMQIAYHPTVEGVRQIVREYREFCSLPCAQVFFCRGDSATYLLFSKDGSVSAEDDDDGDESGDVDDD